MAKALVNGLEIAYEIEGKGEPLVLIGGYTMVKEAWKQQVERLSSQFTVITFDNRGVGQSTVPQEPFTIADMASDTVGLLDHLGISSAHIFGISMGGLIAQVLALDYPERVKKVALGCTTHGGREAISPSPEVMDLLAKAADPTIPPEKAVRMRVPILFGQRFLEEKKDLVEQWVHMAIRYYPSPKGAQGQLKALSRFNSRGRLSEIRCPVLVITGSEDRLIPPENSNLLAQRIPGAMLHLVEGAGHLFFVEEPDEVSRILMEFFCS